MVRSPRPTGGFSSAKDERDQREIGAERVGGASTLKEFSAMCRPAVPIR